MSVDYFPLNSEDIEWWIKIVDVVSFFALILFSTIITLLVII